MEVLSDVKLQFCPACGGRMRPLPRPDDGLWCEWCEHALPRVLRFTPQQQPGRVGEDKA